MVKTSYGIVGKDTNVSDKKCGIKTIFINQIIDNIKSGIIKMPDFQREIDLEKVQEIVERFIELHKKDENYFIKHGYAVSMCKIGDAKDLWVIDGQHRLRAMEKLYPMGYNPYIVIRIQLCDTLDEMKHDYKLLNTNSDLPIVYTSFENEFIQKMLIDIKNEYKRRYNRVFSNGKKETNHTNRLHIDRWLEIFKPALVREKNYLELNKKLMEINDKIKCYLLEGNNYEFYIKTRDNGIINDTQFYLNLKNIKWDDYYYNDGDIIYNTCNYTKKAIPKALKKSVYNRDFGDKGYIGKCWVCSCEIDRDTSHIGHIKAEVMGGKTILDNLRAICITCNLSMGSENMEEFKISNFGN